MTTSQYPLLYVFANLLHSLSQSLCSQMSEGSLRCRRHVFVAIFGAGSEIGAYLHSRLRCSVVRVVDWCEALSSRVDPGSTATTWPTSCVTAVNTACNFLTTSVIDSRSTAVMFLVFQPALAAQHPSRPHISPQSLAGLEPCISYLANIP